jgi:YidC/Oxa1 family membrane protein insertase
MGGCLPLLIQMPVFFALFTVLKNVPGEAQFYGILPSLSMSVANMVDQVGILGAWVYVLFDILFGVLTFLPMWLQQRDNPSEQASQSLLMGGVMAIMMIWFGWSVPSGVLLYYNASALWGIVQQTFVTKRIIEKYKKEEEERLANAPIEVDVVRREHKQRPHKKS